MATMSYRVANQIIERKKQQKLRDQTKTCLPLSGIAFLVLMPLGENEVETCLHIPGKIIPTFFGKAG